MTDSAFPEFKIISPDTPEDEVIYETAIKLADGTIVSSNVIFGLPHWIKERLGINYYYEGVKTYTEVRRTLTMSYGEWEEFDSEAERQAWADEHIKVSKYPHL